MKFYHIFLLVVLLSISGMLQAQQIPYVPTPAAAQQQPILLKGATIHIGNGQVLENAMLAFADGELTFVGSQNVGQGFPGHTIIDLSGKHIYPGFIAPNTSLGLVEIGAVRATRDAVEVGSFNAGVRSLIAYNTDSEVIPTIRSNGILLAQIVPAGGVVSGQSSVVQLDAWNWEDAVIKQDNALHLHWPSRWSWGWGTRKKNKAYEEEVLLLKNTLQEAAAYTQRPKGDVKNLKFEATRGLFDGTKRLFVHTHDARSMTEAVQMAIDMSIEIVIVGGRESYLIANFLRDAQVPVVLRPTQSLPRYADSDIDQPFKTPALLEKAGVLWCFSAEGNWQQRNLAFQAGQAVGFGLDYEKAVRGLTLNTAKILGIDAQVGSLERGKDATLIVTEGDALDMRTARVLHAFIGGREIDLGNKHKSLAKKFEARYERN